MGLYDEEVQCWLANHSFLFTFLWGMGIMVVSLIFIPMDAFWWVRNKLRRIQRWKS